MFPLLAIGGVISAVASVAKGASWLAGKLDSTGTASDSGKAGGKPMTAAQASQFDAVLSAQVAGQSVPVSPSAPVNVLPHRSGLDYNSLASIRRAWSPTTMSASIAAITRRRCPVPPMMARSREPSCGQAR